MNNLAYIFTYPKRSIRIFDICKYVDYNVYLIIRKELHWNHIREKNVFESLKRNIKNNL